MQLEIRRPGWLAAIGGTERVEVVRSVLVRDTDPVYRPVSEFIRENGLVLAASETLEDEDFMFGRCETSVYVPPSVRNGVLAGTEISVPWLGGVA
ncbi:hypothetical protein [Tsukamurella paurometabola]|uniref:Uncharacterized protein n=1 Tax=Tsukamurella paurometabola TaxID=2061 RepID=A0ABS5NJF9_TSUPA|nr:hypothetical protein [Tsukamurella paurometabola]MBS4103962.1 hypothetical protein [Tsukamurella paurometabola]